MTAEGNLVGKPRKERLRRLGRVFDSSPIYFVTACAAKRRPMLATPQLHAAFLQFANAGDAHGTYIGAYVIMPDHIHLFVALDRELTLAAWVKSLKNALSKSLRAVNFSSPHWQKGFFDHVLRSSDSYSQKWEYVRDNPVRAGLAKTWEEWPFNGQVHPLEYRE